MKTVTKYIADDGKEFLSQEECKEYEDTLWFKKAWIGVESGTYAFENLDIYDSTAVLKFLQQKCIITKKPEAPSAKKVLNKGKNN